MYVCLSEAYWFKHFFVWQWSRTINLHALYLYFVCKLHKWLFIKPSFIWLLYFWKSMLNADWLTNVLFHILRIMEFVYTGLCPVSFTFSNRSFPIPSHVTPSDRSPPCALASLSSLKTNRSLDGPYHLSLACWLNQGQKYPQVAQLASTRLPC